MFLGFGFKLLPLVFSLILTVASRLLHLYSTDDKASRLMMKSFSTLRDTRRGSQSYTEKRRGRREIEVTRRRRGGIKRGESKIAINQFPMCSPQSGLLRDVHREEKREGGDRGDLVEKKESQKGERAIKPVITLPSKNVLKIGFLKVQNLITNTKKQRLKI